MNIYGTKLLLTRLNVFTRYSRLLPITREFRRDLRSYRGLVEAYLGARKLKEAVTTAKEARVNLLDSAAALTLLGKVLASPQTAAADKEHAKVSQRYGVIIK